MIESIKQVFEASLLPVNLPFTILLVLVVGYWILVCLGLFHLDSDGEIAFGADHDMDGAPHAGGWLGGALHFIHVGDAPLMAILSVLVLSMWAVSVLANHYLNPAGTLLLGLAILIPNLVLSAILTRYLTTPLKRVYRALNQDYDRAAPIIGQVCQIDTSIVSETFGQATIETRGAPLTIQVRCAPGEQLQRGDQALVISEDSQPGLFRVRKYEAPKLKV